jgi:phosphatidylserine/phosphatidylglycerophosphate/cardiolipin synthase-like enzyme
MGTPFRRAVTTIAFAIAITTLFVPRASAADDMCDTANTDCSLRMFALIDKETVGIDVGFWVMDDNLFVQHLVKRKNAGVPVRVIMDSRSLTSYPENQTAFDAFQQAGIPMMKKSGGGIMHLKLLVFAGQNMVEFGSANFSPFEVRPQTAYTDYISQTVYFTDDPAIVNSFKTKFDDLWVNTSTYSVYANPPAARTRTYPIYPINADLNLPPGQSFTNRLLKLEGAETQQIDVSMYRITQQSQGDGLIAAHNRGVPIRYLGETKEYRLVSRLWVAYNMDRIWLAGIPMRVRAHAGLNHQKLILLYGQATTVFGSSNFTSPSDNSQQENNYFTKKTVIFQWAQAQYERQWNNSGPTGAVETAPFVPLPPDKPTYSGIANGAVGVPTTGQKLVWYGGPWAHLYDIYFGTDPAATTLFAAGQPLGPSATTTQNQSFTLPSPLAAGTTYYWKIVSKTAALLPKAGPVFSFTTAGSTPPPPSTGLPTIVLWASNTPPADVHGTWSMQADATASGGAALANADAGQAKIAPALATPANYFERTFTASQGVPYHLWVRLKAKNNALSNDSVHVQFTGSQDSVGTAAWRVNTTSSAEVVLQGGTSDTSIAGWGWSDNGWGTPGPNIYFDVTGTHTVRVQQREDGAIVDEIVLSPDTYFSVPPGPRDNDNTTLPENDGSATPPPPPPPPPALPTGWSTIDIGAAAVAGSASEASGTYTVAGSGADIWGSADAFRYAYQQLTGDTTMVARVATVQNVNLWTKAGVMVRQSLDAGSQHASMFVTPGKGLSFQRRPTAGGTSLSTTIAGAAPEWVKVSLSGQTVTASVSSDGSTWTTVGQETITFSGPVYVGLAVTSHDNTRTATATFDNVGVTQP